MIRISKTKSWFEVSKSGFKSLQLSKPKTYAVRELIQNAWDEPINECRLVSKFDPKETVFEIEDDSEIGFRKLSDAFTLFDATYKRKDPEKRGIFNLGEKQVFAICRFAEVHTTTGTVKFDKSGRTINYKKKRDKGTKVTIKLKMTKKEYDEIQNSIIEYIIPRHIKFFYQDQQMPYQTPIRTVEKVNLTTVIDEDGTVRKTNRNTQLEIYEPVIEPKLYEMGIPVTNIDCKYSINVMQKVPLSVNRDMVSQSFLQDIYAETLNETYELLNDNEVSEKWVRSATSDKRVSESATKSVLKKRFGPKYCSATPNDPNSMDKAISNGFHVIRGSQLSSDEWDIVRGFDAVQSSGELFGTRITNSKKIEPDKNMKEFEDMAIKIGYQHLKKKITVKFVEFDGVSGQYGDGVLIVNVNELGKDFFNPPISSQTLDFLLHELCHDFGNHIDSSYHRAITRISGKLIMRALINPDWFNYS